MKNSIATTFFLITNFFIVAQDDKLSELQAPSSPASYVLGIEPSALLTPKNYDALETAIYSNFVQDGQLSIPNDLAIEFSPYWTKNHDLTVEEYLYPSLEQSLLRNASFSIASTQNFTLENEENTNALGLGFRTSIYLPNKSSKNKINTKLQYLNSAASGFSTMGGLIGGHGRTENTFEEFWKKTKEEIKTLVNSNPDFAITSADLESFFDFLEESSKSFKYDKNNNNNQAFLQKFLNLVDEKLKMKSLVDDFEQTFKKRYGLTIDLAYAGLFSFPTNDFEFSIVPRQSVWITPSLQLKGKDEKLSFLKLQTVFRYEWYDEGYFMEYFPEREIFENNIDYGLSIITDFKKFSLRFEAVGRSLKSEETVGFDDSGNELFIKKTDNDFQYIGTITYKITDLINVSYNFGNRFEEIQNSDRTIVSFLSLNFGFSPSDSGDIKPQ